MKKRMLGTLEVSSIGLGCMSMSQAYGKPDPVESERNLLHALDVGYTFLDTASVYGLGHNEKLLGRVLKRHRNRYVLASKCGIVVDSDGKRGVDGSPKAITRVCEESLTNLQTDVIDLYYLHRRDHNVPIEESVGALGRLVEAGKIKCIGLSEVSSTTLRRAHAEVPITAVQSEYSLWTRDPEAKVLAACKELGVGFVPFSPLGRAFLCGVIRSEDDLTKRDLRKGMPRFDEENLPKNVELLAGLEEIAHEYSCTTGQLALAWLLAQGDNIVPIPGTKHSKFAEENAAADALVISADHLARADEIVNPNTVSGPRYGESQMISLDPEDETQ
ncbi:MAG: aryl-alcohol dehydrogenase-like predicted oxidoreductase [Myxococcota bacterium]|jgi:aryl-alcohol dehydrogenase-like predicted oxidoreductase